MKRLLSLAGIIIGITVMVYAWVLPASIPEFWTKVSGPKRTDVAALVCCVPVGEEDLLVEGKPAKRQDWTTRIRHRWLPIAVGTVSGLTLLGCAGYLIRLSVRRDSKNKPNEDPDFKKRQGGKE